MDNIPKHWVAITLGEIGKWGSGGTPKRGHSSYYNGNIPWVKSGDLCDGPIAEVEERISEVGLRNSSAKVFPPGSVVIAMYGATIGKLGILDFPAATNQACAAVLPACEIPSRFIFFYLKHEKKRLVQKGKGGAQPNISQEVLKAHPALLPPLQEQIRITEKLEELLGKLAIVTARLSKIPEIINKFRQSALDAAYSGKISEQWRTDNPNATAEDLVKCLKKNYDDVGGHKRGNAAQPTDGVHELVQEELPSSWRIIEMRDACQPGKPITYGILKPGPNVKNGVQYLKVKSYPGDMIDMEKVPKTTRQIEAEFSRARLSEGDIVLSIRGTVGRLCVVPKELEGANITQDSARLSISPLIERDYIRWLLKSPQVQARMTSAMKGVAVRGINIGDVRALQVPLPPPEEQKVIVDKINNLFGLASAVEGAYESALKKISRIESSLLKLAFEGRLVQQDPSDEPASELLKRVRLSLEAAVSAKKLARSPGNQKARTVTKKNSRVSTSNGRHASVKKQLRAKNSENPS